MKSIKKIIFGLILIYTSMVFSQQRSYHEDALRYFEINGTEKQYSLAIDQMFTLLKKQYSTLEVPEKIWNELEEGKKESLKHIKSLLVTAYQSNFSHIELKEMLSFYESETGKQIVKDISGLSEDQKLKFAAFQSSDTGKKLQQQSENLKNMVAQASELWSRDLYREVVQALKARGFTMPE